MINMPTTIYQTLRFRNTSAAELFAIYASSKRHATAVEASASIGGVGERFWVFHPQAVRGLMLHLSENKLVVQSWRSKVFKKSDPDSIVVLAFADTKNGGQITLTHANLPSRLVAHTARGWNEMYWASWRRYLADEKRQAVGLQR